MAVPVASLMIEIAANIAQLRTDFDKAGKVVGDFQSKVMAVGKAIGSFLAVREVIGFGEQIQANIDAMSDAAENLKIPVEEFQTLQSAALLAGQSIEATGNALGKFNVFVGKASEGNKETIETLNSLGLTINKMDGTAKSTTQRLQETAIAITSISDPAKRAAAEVAIFGKSGQQVSAILEQLKRPLDEINRELQALGLVHSPEVIKQMSAMADESDRVQKKIEVLFAPLYAAVKNLLFQSVAFGFQLIANAVNAINAGNIDAIARSLAALALIPTIVGAPAGVALLMGIKKPLDILEDQINDTKKQVDGLRESLGKMKDNPAFTDAQKLAEIDRLADATQKLWDLEKKRNEATGAVVDLKPPGGKGTNPAVKGSGVDKYAEAMRRIGEETKGAKLAIEEFQKQTAAGVPTKEAERYAKLQQDIANKQSSMTKDLTADQAKTVKPLVAELERWKYALESLKQSQRDADQINDKYGDGLNDQIEAIQKLNDLRNSQLIGDTEYLAALKDINKAAEEQRLIHQGLQEGLIGLAAGFQLAAAKMGETQTSFQLGQQIFTSSVGIMSNAISEFAEKGVLDFGKLAASFAKMLADMAAQMAARAILKAVFALAEAGLGAAAGAGAGSPAGQAAPHGSAPTGFWDRFSAAYAKGGGRAGGGPVSPGFAYTVGENGPERFIPHVPGRIEANGGGGGTVVVNLDMKKAEGARDPTAALEFGRRIKAAVMDVIENEKRPGGTLYGRATA